MLTIFLLSVITTAFIVLRFSPDQFYKLHRYEGQLLYIKAIFIGVSFSFITLLIDLFTGMIQCLSNIFPQHTWYFAETQSNTKFLSFLLVTNMAAIFWCLLNRGWLILLGWWRLGELSIDKANIILMYRILNDSPLDQLFFSSYVEGKFLFITMTDRKAYVGRVISLGEPNERNGPDQEIRIVPIFSGYRDKDTLSLVLTTKYEPSENADLSIILKQENITSACEFIEDLYEKISSNKS